MTGPVGPRGLTVLVIVAIAGLLLAVLGWHQRGTGLVPPRSGQAEVRLVYGGAPR